MLNEALFQPGAIDRTLRQRCFVAATWSALVLSVLNSASVGRAEGQDLRQSIPEAVAAGAVSSVATTPSGPVPRVDDLLRTADLVVVGTVGEPHSYLSDDQRDIYTDYSLLGSVVLFDSRFGALSAPHGDPTVTVTQRGGTLLVHGVMFTHKESALAPLRAGREGLFILQRLGNRYLIAHRYFGAFDLTDGTMIPLAAREDFGDRYRGMDARSAVDAISARIRVLRQ